MVSRIVYNVYCDQTISESDTSIRPVNENGFLKYRLKYNSSKQVAHYGCIQDPSVTYRQKINKFGAFMKISYTKQCPNDDKFYQVCGIDEPIFGSNEFLCGKYNCEHSAINTKFKYVTDMFQTCNGENDCMDGIDEKYCADIQFCDDRGILHRRQICDGLEDCKARGEDEIGCNHGIGMSCSMMEDNRTKIWLPGNRICDGVEECEGGADEKNCGNYSAPGVLCVTNKAGSLFEDQFVDFRLFCSNRTICIQDLVDQLNCPHSVLICHAPRTQTQVSLTQQIICNKRLPYSGSVCDDFIDAACM